MVTNWMDVNFDTKSTTLLSNHEAIMSSLVLWWLDHLSDHIILVTPISWCVITPMWPFWTQLPPQPLIDQAWHISNTPPKDQGVQLMGVPFWSFKYRNGLTHGATWVGLCAFGDVSLSTFAWVHMSLIEI